MGGTEEGGEIIGGGGEANELKTDTECKYCETERDHFEIEIETVCA